MTSGPTVDEPAAPWSLWALSATVAVAFGVLLYAVSVLITEEAAGSVFSATVLSAGYGGSLLTGGLLAPVVGRYVDRHGIGRVLMVGVVLGAGGMTAFSAATEPWHVLVAFWLLIGPAGSMTFYEPAFVAVDQWFGTVRRARSLAILTVVGGLAGPIFLPLTSFLLDQLGWRAAGATLASGLLIMGLVASVLVARMPFRPRRPMDSPVLSLARDVLRDPRFVVYTLSIAASFAAVQGLLLHRIARFEAAGFLVATAAAGAAVASILSFPGRFASPYLADRVGGIRVQVVALSLLAVSALVAIDGSQGWQLWAHFVIFGVAFGAVLPLRATVMSDWYSGPNLGRIMGTQWLVASLAGAGGPAVVGLLRDSSAGYALPMTVVTGILVLSAVLAAVSGRLSGKALDPHVT
ncbi:MAG: MFS transporter [Acidimicrobiia bacterium]|nr:MFS transporter [Acidimicrobiia bacterium]